MPTTQDLNIAATWQTLKGVKIGDLVKLPGRSQAATRSNDRPFLAVTNITKGTTWAKGLEVWVEGEPYPRSVGSQKFLVVPA